MLLMLCSVIPLHAPHAGGSLCCHGYSEHGAGRYAVPWWNYLGVGSRPAGPERALSTEHGLTAAASTVAGPQTSLLRNTDTWQNEVWGYFDNVGEFRYAAYWEANMMSRVRLYAAEVMPGEDEPKRLESGPAVDLVNTLGGGAAGQAQLLSRLTVQLAVPGEGYLVGEARNGVERWTIRSVDEVRVMRGRFEVVDEASSNAMDWRALGDDALVVRVYRPHSRWLYMADSPARAARSTLRELELVNRHIIGQYLSRLASAGVIIFPDEVSFPVKEEHAEAEDPFMVEWVEIAATAIREPGTASAVVPIPIRIPGEYVDKVKHIDFTLQLDEQIIEKRDSAIKRLATQVNIPAEVLLGMGDVNHWGAWQLEEGALKTSIAPDAELISQAITQGYLQPRLAASGVENPERFVVWYDMSELTVRPDRSSNARELYDRLELSGTALRREGGFNESDKPDTEDLKEQGLKSILRTLPSGAGSALSELLGERIIIAPALPIDPRLIGTGQSGRPPSVEEIVPASPHQEPEQGPPQTQDNPPPEPDMAARRTDRLLAQAKSPHAARFAAGRWEILHPGVCEQHAYSCPFTHAALTLRSRPGRSGTYECSLDTFGRLRIGDLSPQMSIDTLVPTRMANGHGS